MNEDTRTQPRGNPGTSRGAFNRDQEEALRLLTESDDNLFITGGAGTGKSWVVRSMVRRLEESGINVLVCAPTGLAAMNIEGMTLHSAFGFPAECCLVSDGSGTRLRTSVRSLLLLSAVLIIDEISMVSQDLFDTVYLSLQEAERKSGHRIRLIVVGDFFQIAPVPPDAPARELMESFYGKPVGNTYAFLGRYWDECHFRTVILQESVRQADSVFVANLNLARKGDASCIGYLNQAYGRQPGEGVVSLYAWNRQVNAINTRMLDTLPGERVTYTTTIECGEGHGLDILDGSLLKGIPHHISFKDGALVIFTATGYGRDAIRLHGNGYRRDPAKPQYVNGMGGTIMGICGQSVIVRTARGDLVDVLPVSRPIFAYSIEKERLVKKRVATYTQYPFVLAYALSIHRSQGQTFTSAVVCPKTFAPGQLYVALSRLTGFGGLYLTSPISPSDLIVDPAVLAFYGRLEKKAGISGKRGRPVKNTDGSMRDQWLWVPNTLLPHVTEEIRLNRPVEMPASLPYQKGRTHLRAPSHLIPHLKDELKGWKSAEKTKKEGGRR